MMTDRQIKYMVDRFLMWKLPETFSPDAGISFNPTFNHHAPGGPQKYQPVGTNLFDAQQATSMVRYMVEGMPPVNIGKKWQWLSSNGWIDIDNPSFERITELLDSGYALRRAAP